MAVPGTFACNYNANLLTLGKQDDNEGMAWCPLALGGEHYILAHKAPIEEPVGGYLAKSKTHRIS